MTYSNTVQASVMFFCLSAGTIFYLIGVQSPIVIIVGLLFYLTGRILIRFIFNSSWLECRAFNCTFIVCWFWAAISACYITFFNDQFQLNSDPDTFFRLATNNVEGMSIDNLWLVINAPGAVLVWRSIYNFFCYVGVPKEMYIGINLNILCVSLSAVLTLKIAKKIFGDDVIRLKRLIVMCACCGNFWLLASIHLRDCIVLLVVTTFIYICMLVLLKPTLIRLLMMVLVTSVFSFALNLLRKELMSVPIGIVLAAFFAYILAKKRNNADYLICIIGGIGVLIGLVIFYHEFLDKIIGIILADHDKYNDLSLIEADSDSLGTKLILTQSFPIKVILGSIYLYVFPIPFWSGFQFESSYHLFKSFNAIFMYFMLPLAFLAITRLMQHKKLRLSSILFMLFITLEFTLAIASSSLETRHLMVFLPPFLILCLLPDLHDASDKRAYKRILFYFLLGVGILHLIWAILKLL